MASKEHIQLSDYIKSTHKNLRKNYKLLGFDTAWKLHCQDVDHLQKYAIAMEKLATKYWKNNTKSNIDVNSRIEWIYNYCVSYFFNQEIIYYRKRELDIAAKIFLNQEWNFLEVNEKLKLLDVGSCYNAFKAYDCFQILPIDIAPATEDVFQCDFLKLNIVDMAIQNRNTSRISELTKCTFDVVVFSLLLEYLPSPEQRLKCCTKAYKLLKTEGLLIIITPDSNHVGVNAKIMKSWRYHLAKLGFSRIKYEKLTYIHCMVFRKCLDTAISYRWAEFQDPEKFHSTFVIPQDFNEYLPRQNVECNGNNSELYSELFNELPNN